MNAVLPSARAVTRRWVTSRPPRLGSWNVTMSPGRASSGAMYSSMTTEPTPSVGSMLPEITVSAL
jgi:hypothetical protein